MKLGHYIVPSHQRFNGSITAVGWCFIAFGLVAVAGVIGGAFNHHINIDLNIFAFPIGIGILQRRAAARKWALIFLWVSAFELTVAAGIVMWGVFAHTTFDALIFGRKVGYISGALVCLCLIPFLALVVWCQQVLTRAEAKQQFEQLA
jgi:hypothetical protein